MLLVGWQEGHPACKKLSGRGKVICLERGADLHMAQLMPWPLTVSCFSKILIGFTFLALAHLGSPEKALFQDNLGKLHVLVKLGARDYGVLGCSGISWTICKQSAPCSRQITTPTSHHSIFSDWMLFVMLNQQCQSTEGKLVNINTSTKISERYTAATAYLTIKHPSQSKTSCISGVTSNVSGSY